MNNYNRILSYILLILGSFWLLFLIWSFDDKKSEFKSSYFPLHRITKIMIHNEQENLNLEITDRSQINLIRSLLSQLIKEEVSDDKVVRSIYSMNISFEDHDDIIVLFEITNTNKRLINMSNQMYSNENLWVYSDSIYNDMRKSINK